MRAAFVGLVFAASLAAGPIRGGALRSPAGKDVEAALGALNAARSMAGLGKVSLDAEMSEASRLHAEYLKKNHGRPEIAGLRAHEEDAGLSGFTKEGARAGKSSDIAFVPLPVAVETWINSLYHRTPILHPSLKRVGMGSAVGPNGPVAVLMFEPLSQDAAGFPVKYPADGQMGVPLTFSGEIPDPVPAGKPATGSPVTVAFGKLPVKNVSARLTDAAGVDVPVYLSSPQKPATTFPQDGVVCLLPTRPFRPSTRYRANVEAVVGGIAQSWEWHFTTARPLAVDAGDVAAVEAATGQLVTLTGNVADTGKIPGYSFLQIGGSKETMVSVFIRDDAWPEFTRAGIDGVGRYSGQRVEALGVPQRTDRYLNVVVSSPEDLRVLKVELPAIDADGPVPSASVGKLVRVRGRVRQTGTISGYVYLTLGESNGRSVSAFIPDAAWKKFGLTTGSLVGRTVTVRGVLRLDQGKYLNLSVERPEQLEWAN